MDPLHTGSSVPGSSNLTPVENFDATPLFGGDSHPELVVDVSQRTSKQIGMLLFNFLYSLSFFYDDMLFCLFKYYLLMRKMILCLHLSHSQPHFPSFNDLSLEPLFPKVPNLRVYRMKRAFIYRVHV